MDDGFDDLFKKLFEALDFNDPELQQKIRRSIDEGLDQVGFTRNVTVDIDLDGDGPPDVRVIDGGRGDDDPTSEVDDEDKPDLEVLDGDGGSDKPKVDVRVERVSMGGPSAPAASGTEGRIAARGQQTLFRGTAPAAYRLYVQRGEAQVVLDGSGVETLTAGQTMDVEASMIQVRGDADGSYRRLITVR